MKAINTLSLVTLALTATTFLACSNDNLTIENNPTKQDKIVTLTATLSPKGGTNTKALTDPGNGTLTSTWTVNEEIEVQYEKSTDPADNPSGSVKATVTSVDGSGKATINVDLVDPKDGNTGIYFHYPYSLATGTKHLNNDQIGTLPDVATNFDDVTGEGTLNVSGGVATLPTGVAMTRNVCVWKFSFTDGSSDITSAVTALNIKVGRISEYNVTPSSLDAIYVAMFKADNQPVTVTATTAAGTFSRTTGAVSLAKNKLYTSTNLALIKQNIVALGGKTENYTASNGDVLTGTLPAAYRVIIPDGATVTLNGATIAYGSKDYPAISCEGNATIILANGSVNTVTVPDDNTGGYSQSPGILVGPSGKKLIITGSGSLTVTGGYIAAAIGNINIGYPTPATCGVIQIDGGNITATGGEAGIGTSGGYNDTCDGIIINSGYLNIYGYTVGIGASGSNTVDYISITGGEIHTRGGLSGAGIGTGPDGECGNITISGGDIYAIGDEPGIGSGANGTCGNIIISDGTVRATSSCTGDIDIPDGTGPGIGSGNAGSCGTISIQNTITQIIAKGGSFANPAIGAGMSGATCGTITINAVDIAGETINDGANTIGGMTLTQTDSGFTWTIVP